MTDPGRLRHNARGTRNLLRRGAGLARQGGRARLDQPADAGASYRIAFELVADPTGILSSNEYRIAVQGGSPVSPWRGWASIPRFIVPRCGRYWMPGALLDLMSLIRYPLILVN